jgi:cyanophycinase
MKLLGMSIIFLLIILISKNSAVQPPKSNRGALVLAGGGELPISIKNKFFSLSGGSKTRLVCVTSANPRHATYWWTSHKLQSVIILNAKHRDEANIDDFCEPLRDATALWFTGGNQSRLTDLYNNTLFQYEMEKFLERGGTIGGSSAGASVVTEVMMDEGRGLRGFGLLDRVIVDQHFSQRKRLPRLLNLLRQYPTQSGIGIDEGTAVVISENKACVIGNGSVTFCKGADVFTYRDNESFQLP